MANNLVRDFTRLLSLQKIHSNPVSDLVFTVRFPKNGGKFSAPSKPNGFDSAKVMFATRRKIASGNRWLGWGNFGTIKDMKHGEFEYILELNFLEWTNHSIDSIKPTFAQQFA